MTEENILGQIAWQAYEASITAGHRDGRWGTTRYLMKHHFSDCAVHNGPALPTGECNCEAMYDAKQVESLIGDLRAQLLSERQRREKVEALLQQWLDAQKTGRSEPLFIMKNATENYFEDHAALTQPKEEAEG